MYQKKRRKSVESQVATSGNTAHTIHRRIRTIPIGFMNGGSSLPRARRDAHGGPSRNCTATSLSPEYAAPDAAAAKSPRRGHAAASTTYEYGPTGPDSGRLGAVSGSRRRVALPDAENGRETCTRPVRKVARRPDEEGLVEKKLRVVERYFMNRVKT